MASTSAERASDRTAVAAGADHDGRLELVTVGHDPHGIARHADAAHAQTAAHVGAGGRGDHRQDRQEGEQARHRRVLCGVRREPLTA